MGKKIKKNELLFHVAHGLCRVVGVDEAPKEEASYALRPVSKNKAKIRFVIPESAMGESGFCRIVSAKEGDAILSYLKTGKKAMPEAGQAWSSAVIVRSESRSKDSVKDARKRQQVERAVNGLVGELSHALQITLDETIERVQQSLGRVSRINPVVMAALSNVERD